eukprot:s1834_g4.t1
MQRPRVLNFGTVLDSQEAYEIWNQPDRLRHPDSASFQGTELDPSDSSDLGAAATAEPEEPRSPATVTQQPEALGMDSTEPAAPLEGMEEGLNGEPLSEDDLESVERGSSVEPENEEFLKKKDWVMKMDDAEIDARIEKLFAHPRWDRFLKEQANPNEHVIHDKVTLLAFWEICRPYYESAEGRPVAREQQEKTEEEPFVILRHADQANLRSGKRLENQEKKGRKKAADHDAENVAKPKRKAKTQARAKATAKASAKAASKRKVEEKSTARGSKARKKNVDTDTVATDAAAQAEDVDASTREAAAPAEDGDTPVPDAPAPREDVATSIPDAAAPSAPEGPDHASMDVEPSETGAARRRRRHPQLIDKDEQTKLKKRLGFDSLYLFDVLIFLQLVAFLCAVLAILRLFPGSVVLLAPVCSSFSYMCSSQSLRVFYMPEGDEAIWWVKEGNVMSCRVTLLCWLCCALGIVFVLEQPGSGKFGQMPRWQHFCSNICYVI